MPNPSQSQWTPHGQPVPGRVEPFQAALLDFRKARKQASMEAIIGRLTGKSLELLSYKEVAEKLKLKSGADRGVQDIPVEAIVGSFGRYSDFSRTFLPRHDWDAERWANVKAASEKNQPLPPIDVYKVGDVYFVEDGNHRVSIARQQGQEHIAAHVTEVKSRVPLTPDVQTDQLILKSEQVDFLESTQLDTLRPGSELSVTFPGQYDKLCEHIELHRHFVETDEGRQITDQEAVVRWYDEAYLPIIATIREQGILRDFPARTEADLYLWITEHQNALREELGWQVRPEAIMSRTAAQFEVQSEGLMSQAYHKVLHAISPKKLVRSARHDSLAQRKLLARYSDTLFGDILVPLSISEDWQALSLALIIAEREEAQIDGLLPLDSGVQADDPAVQSVDLTFREYCQAAEIDGSLAIEHGQTRALLGDRAALTDLIVLNRQLLANNTRGSLVGEQLQEMAQHCDRPAMLAGTEACFMRRLILIWDHQATAEDALYAATYLSERWHIPLVVVALPAKGSDGPKAIERVHSYLELHEIEATFMSSLSEDAEKILQPLHHQNDLLITGGYRGGLFQKSAAANPANHWIEHWDGAVLVCS